MTSGVDARTAAAAMDRPPLRITDVWVAELARPLGRNLSNPLLSFSESRTVVVVVETDGGPWGIGEAWAAHRPSPALRTLIEQQIRPLLIGADPSDVEHLHDRIERSFSHESRGMVAAALSGVDIALWDLRGRAADAPIFRLLGGSARPLPVYASGGIYAAGEGVAELAAEMCAYVGGGFRMVKMKIGGAPLDVDLARVRAVREAIGPGVGIAVDACYYAYDADAAIRAGRALEPMGIAFLEAPVAPHDREGMAAVRAALDIPIAGNEVASTRHAFRDLIQGGCVDLVQPNVTIAGGITETLRIAALAREAGLPITFQASASAITLAASLHVASSLPNVHSVEYHQVHQLLFDGTGDAFGLRDGALAAPEAPGLGLPFRPDEIRALAVA